jgi:predicted nucleic acid-binding protein
LEEALITQQQHGLQFWDAMLWATARRAGCSLIATEDFQDGRTLGGVTFRNPFKLSDAEWNALLTD